MYEPALGTLFGPGLQEASSAPRETEPLRMAPANPEAVVADRVLEALEGKYKALLEWMRDRMRTLYFQREKSQGRELAFVTADDARLILDTDPNVPGPDRLKRNFMGSLFKAKGWEFTGQMIKSKTPGSHANRLLCWRYVGA